MSSAGVANGRKEEKKGVVVIAARDDDTSSSTADHGDLEEYEEDTNHDDYIREFSFEPEIIVPKRTASANSLSCATTAQPVHTPKEASSSCPRPHKDSNHKQHRVRFLRPPNSLSLSLLNGRRGRLRCLPPGTAPSSPTQAQPSTTEPHSIAPHPPHVVCQLYKDDSGDGEDGSGPSTSSGRGGIDYKPVSLAGAEPTKQQRNRPADTVVGERIFKVGVGEEEEGSSGDSSERVHRKRSLVVESELSFNSDPPRTDRSASSASEEEGDNSVGSGDSGERRGRRRKRRKSRRFWWCTGGKKDRPSSAEQVHHEIEAFYYVGTKGGER